MPPPSVRHWDDIINTTHRHLSSDDVSLFMAEDFLPNLIARVEHDLESTVRDFNTKCEAEMSNMSPEDRDHYGDSKSDAYWEISEVAPRIMRQSLLVTIYGSLENRLKNFCHSAHADGLCITKPKKKNWYLDNSKDYFMTGIALPQAAFQQHWDRLDGYRAVRNIVVHNDGVLAQDDQSDPARAFIQNEADIGIEDHYHIRLDRGFCETFAAFTSTFLGTLITELKKCPAVTAPQS